MLVTFIPEAEKTFNSTVLPSLSMEHVADITEIEDLSATTSISKTEFVFCQAKSGGNLR